MSENQLIANEAMRELPNDRYDRYEITCDGFSLLVMGFKDIQ